LDEHVPDEVLEILGVEGTSLDRTPVDDDACGLPGLCGEAPAERHATVLPGCRVRRRDVLDRELRPTQLLGPRALDPFDDVHDDVVELLRPRAARGGGGRQERPADAATTAVPASRHGSLAARTGRTGRDDEVVEGDRSRGGGAAPRPAVAGSAPLAGGLGPRAGGGSVATHTTTLARGEPAQRAHHRRR